MADESTQDTVWNAYIDKHDSEPTYAQQLLNFSKNKTNNVTTLTFSNARKTFDRNKGKGKIDNVTSNPSAKHSSDDSKSNSGSVNPSSDIKATPTTDAKGIILFCHQDTFFLS